MLGKLLKHEFYATGKNLLPIYGITLILSLLNRIIINIDVFDGPLEVVKGLMIAAYVISIIATLIVTAIIIILRFYKNLMTDEGYLMFTLPVKPLQLINSKLITSIIWIIVSVITVILSLLILLANSKNIEYLKGFFEGMLYVFKAEFGDQYVLVMVEFGLIMVISIIQQILLIYVSIAVGHLFNGHKVLGSFAAYIVINTAVQIILTVLLFVLSRINPSTFEEASSVPEVVFPITIIVGLTLCTLYYLSTNYIFSRKLNLE